MLFKDYTVDYFLEELSSDAPSPGGGSTAALVAALAGSLNSMVYSLTVGKKAFENLDKENQNKMIKLKEETSKFIKVSQEFMEEDRRDFLVLMDCYKLSKNTEEEIALRKKNINKCTIKAMETPLRLAKACLDFYNNIDFAVEFGNKNLVSDAGVAASLLHSAIESAAINVKVNLSFVKSEYNYKEVEDTLESILSKSNSLKNELLEKVNKIIYK
ncbi:formiminotransferase-cyclodeaminase [Clostridium tertium]|uniref:Methenyltetrahydrofolate cyclohydrolase n=1 Tax=Clostridium tertium TaxID=1559 RepID=A0A6N3GH64_9CLOT